MKHDVKHIR
ncbi:predicted protein [Fibroporia radiculosa]|uniref:Uncharacterized protein n=1 Tax=Fibroporia radiculosa TaxID=599839 RepID=J7RHX3_9APHY|nr:predicted protein [Fibroporia radiculosa]